MLSAEPLKAPSGKPVCEVVDCEKLFDAFAAQHARRKLNADDIISIKSMRDRTGGAMSMAGLAPRTAEALRKRGLKVFTDSELKAETERQLAEIKKGTQKPGTIRMPRYFLMGNVTLQILTVGGEKVTHAIFDLQLMSTSTATVEVREQVGAVLKEK